MKDDRFNFGVVYTLTILAIGICIPLLLSDKCYSLTDYVKAYAETSPGMNLPVK